MEYMLDTHVVLFSVIQLERPAALATAAQLGQFFVCFEADTEHVGVRKRLWPAWFRFHVVPVSMQDIGRLGGVVLGEQRMDKGKDRTSGLADMDAPTMLYRRSKRSPESLLGCIPRDSACLHDGPITRPAGVAARRAHVTLLCSTVTSSQLTMHC